MDLVLATSSLAYSAQPLSASESNFINTKLVAGEQSEVLSSTLFTAITGILTSAAGARFLGVVGAASQASVLTRCITTPLAIAAVV